MATQADRDTSAPAAAAFSASTPPGHAPGLRGGLLRFATLLSLLSERTASEDASVRTAVSHRIRCELRREAAFNSALRRTTTLSSAPPIGAVQNDRAQVELDQLGRQCWESAIRQITRQRRFGRSDEELFDEELCGDDQDERRRFPGARLHSLTVASSPNATARISAVLCLRRRLRLLGSGWQAFTRCLAEQLDDVPVRDTDRASATRSARLAANRPSVEHDTVLVVTTGHPAAGARQHGRRHRRSGGSTRSPSCRRPVAVAAFLPTTRRPS